MFYATQRPLDFWTGPARDAAEFWISLWPVAPFFGVKWQFDSRETVSIESGAEVEIPAVTSNDGDLRQIKGIGPNLEAQLKAHGITSLTAIAAMDDADLKRMDEALTSIKGRCFRDDWVGQAKALVG